MILIGFKGKHFDDLKILRQQIQKGLIGGLLVMNYNIINKRQITKLIRKIKKVKSSYPLFIALDQEGGRVSRLNTKKGYSDFPSHKDVAKKLSKEKAYKLYSRLAKALKISDLT